MGVGLWATGYAVPGRVQSGPDAGALDHSAVRLRDGRVPQAPSACTGRLRTCNDQQGARSEGHGTPAPRSGRLARRLNYSAGDARLGSQRPAVMRCAAWPGGPASPPPPFSPWASASAPTPRSSAWSTRCSSGRCRSESTASAWSPCTRPTGPSPRTGSTRRCPTTTSRTCAWPAQSLEDVAALRGAQLHGAGGRRSGAAPRRLGHAQPLPLARPPPRPGPPLPRGGGTGLRARARGPPQPPALREAFRRRSRHRGQECRPERPRPHRHRRDARGHPLPAARRAVGALSPELRSGTATRPGAALRRRVRPAPTGDHHGPGAGRARPHRRPSRRAASRHQPRLGHPRDVVPRRGRGSRHAHRLRRPCWGRSRRCC